MSTSEKQTEVSVNAGSVKGPVRNADDTLLAELGYKAEFKREFSVSHFLPSACVEVKIQFCLDDRDNCFRLLNHGCSGFCGIYILISIGLRCVLPTLW